MTTTVPRTSATSSDIQAGTAQRLLAAEEAVFGDRRAPEDAEPRLAGSLALARLVDHLIEGDDASVAWLMLTVVAGVYPSSDDVRALRRAAQLGTSQEVTLTVLDRTLPAARRHGTAHRNARIVGGVVVDVDSCARSDFHNGIQRVARETIRAWRGGHDLTLVGWTDTAGVTRELSHAERIRAAYWGSPATELDALTRPQTPDEDLIPSDPVEVTLVIPWRATLVLIEVPLPDRCPALAALAEVSGNRVVAVGYDAIPVVSADLRPLGEANAFTSYLSVIKHSARVAGISTSATAEFEGFAHAVSSQGLPGPEVSEVALPADVPPVPSHADPSATRRPQVLSVGRLEPHKNHAAILHAAERLWREGLEFDLTLVGADGWSTTAVDQQLAALREAGRAVHRPQGVSDEAMWRLVREATFSVFVSLHEGFGLPVAESLACGTPVITTAYGSQGEIALAGGCLTVDPRDDDDLYAAMRALLTEPETLTRLRHEAAARPQRTWQDYAHELWDTLVDDGSRR